MTQDIPVRRKRRPFLLKGNFQLTFIIGFVLLLLFETILAGVIIYRLSASALEKAIFSSHITIDRSAQLMIPIIIEVNVCFILISIFLAISIVSISYIRLRILLHKMICGLEALRDNQIPSYLRRTGAKKHSNLIDEYNQMVSYIDGWLKQIHSTLEGLIIERDVKNLQRLQNRLRHLIVGKK